MKKKTKAIVLLIALTLVISNIVSYVIYDKITLEDRADYNIRRGYSYLESSHIEKAEKSFEKAMKIKKNSVEARIGLAWTYADKDDYESARNILLEAYDIDHTHSGLIVNSAKLLKSYDIDSAYQMLAGYMESVDGNLVDPEVLQIRADMLREPEVPDITPLSGKYVNSFSVEFNMDTQPLGTRIYYTTDGSEPSNTSELYREPLPLEDGNLVVRAVAYNAIGDKSGFVTGEYSVDPSALDELNKEIKSAQAIYDDTTEGTSVGNCIAGAKEPLGDAIAAAKETAAIEDLHFDEASEACDILISAVKTFNNQIIEKTDLTELNAAIKVAQDLIKNKKEGTEPGNQKVGSKNTLQKKIDAAIAVKNDILSGQTDIDAALANLNSAIAVFKSSIVKR